MCLLLIFVFIPTQIYVLCVNLAIQRTTFSWSETHDPASWNDIIMVESHGKVLFDRWLWLYPGIVIFIFFGLGKEAVTMYRSGLLAVGLGKVIPSLSSDYSSRHSETDNSSSFGSKAKLFLKRKSSSILSWHSESVASHNSGIVVPDVGKGMTSLETIKEDQYAGEKSSFWPFSANSPTSKAQNSEAHQSMLGRFTSVFKTDKVQVHQYNDDLTPESMSGQPVSVHSNTSTGPSSPVQLGVIVKKEVRQASEAADDVRR